MPNLTDIWNELKQQANAKDADVLERLVSAYAESQERLQPEIDALTEQLDAMMKSGSVSKKDVVKTAAYKNLIREVVRELDNYEGYLHTEIDTAIKDSAARGLADSQTLLLAALAISLGVSIKDVPKDTLKQPDSLDFLANYLERDGALYKRIDELSNYHAEQIASAILDGVGSGFNPRDIADLIADKYGMGLTDAMRQCRTVQLYSYRQANNAVQVANGDLLEGVVWSAELDDRTCASCIALHGTVYPVGTVADDHHNGRCAMLPWVKGADKPIDQTGEDWLNEQSSEVQQSVLGAKYDGWNNGDFELKDIVGTYHSDIYGDMISEKPLKDLQ